MTSGLPFDDMRNLARALPQENHVAAERVRADFSEAGGRRALGRLEELAVWFAAATGRVPARTTRPAVALFAATHSLSIRLGIADPVFQARAGVEAIASGAAPVSHLCAAGNLGLNVFDLALEMPVEDITRAPALDERAAAATMAFGMEAIASGADLVCLGTVDAAGDPSAMALISALAKTAGEEWKGQGETMQAAVAQALETHGNHLGDPLEAMRRLGGRDIAALAGAILAARTQNVAVILDGLAATAAAATLHALNEDALAHCILASAAGPMHREAAKRIGLEPVQDLGISAVGGVGAALASGLVKAAGEISAGLAETHGQNR